MKYQRIPPWLKAAFGPQPCSICNSQEVYFERAESCGAYAEEMAGAMLETEVYHVRRWCRDCFEDCGGDIKCLGG